MWWKPPTLPSQSGLSMCSDGLLRLVWRVDSEGLMFYDGSISGQVDTLDASEVIAGAVSAGFRDLIMRILVP